jgi:hypothetical protein
MAVVDGELLVGLGGRFSGDGVLVEGKGQAGAVCPAFTVY